jgi:proline iminopeptidase
MDYWTRTGVFYRSRQGGGLPLLTLHGGPGWDHTYLRSTFYDVDERLRVVHLDLAGCGRSTKSPNVARPMEGWADDVAEVLATLGLERAVIFGHSFGGFVAQIFARRHPDRVAGLVLCSTAPTMAFMEEGSRALHHVASPDQLEAQARVFSLSVESDAEFAQTTDVLLPLYFRQELRPEWRRAINSMTHRWAPFARALEGGLVSFDETHTIREIQLPVLVMAGAHDIIIPYATGPGSFAGLSDRVKMIRFDESGHFPFWEEAARFGEALDRWLLTNQLLAATGESYEPTIDAVASRNATGATKST